MKHPIWAGVLVAVALAACDSPGIDSRDPGLAPFDPSAVIYADGCEPLPEAQPCVDAHPRQFDHADSTRASEQCEALGYTCCDPADWISAGAAACIADADARMSERYANHVTMSCYDDVFGPMYNVYETNAETFVGIGIHAATGRVTWFDDGSGVFS